MSRWVWNRAGGRLWRETSRQRRDGLAILALVGVAVVVLWRLALTDLIIGRGDIFFYFYPYRDYASAAVRAGRVPLWNPYLFMGVPFVANSQAGFFYPLNLSLAWLPVERMVNASILIHVGLATTGAFLWGRGGLGLSRPAAWLTGLSYGLGGYFLAQVEHLNQIQVLAWLPWLFWLYAARLRFLGWRWVGLGLVIAGQFLAGHTQSVFISLVGLASYALLPVAGEVLRQRLAWRALLRPLGIVAGGVLLGVGLAAVQLLPTLELSQLSMRSGGLPYREAVSFSLRPALVGRALLPGWGGSLFPEFVAYVGVAGMGLAALGGLDVYFGRPGEEEIVRYSRRGALLLVVLGLFFALGGYNPLYMLLVRFAPGFGLFRAPARWLALYGVGAAGLAGIGLQGLIDRARKRSHGLQRGPLVERRHWLGWLFVVVTLAALVILGQLLGDEWIPTENGRGESDLTPALGLGAVAGWGVAALAFSLLLYFYGRKETGISESRLTSSLIVLVVVELWGASLALPFNRATAPGALTSLRPAVAYLRAEADAVTTGPPARFLSISDIFFDPGDKADIELSLGPRLSADALYDYVIATKQKEVLIPNLPLYYRLPAMDGYDGGVLPLRNYVTLERLYMPPGRVSIDGRLRENLQAVPEGRWMSLFNVRFIVTDKVGDAWFDGVFYDLQMGAELQAGEWVAVGHVPNLETTALGVVYQASGAPQGTPLAEVEVSFTEGQEVLLPLLAGEPMEDGNRVARLRWGEANVPVAIRLQGRWSSDAVTIRGLSLIDERTDAFRPLVLSDRGRYRLVHSGDVKVYENLELLPRLSFVPQAVAVPDDAAALAAMRDPGFDPSAVVVLSDAKGRDLGSEAEPLATVQTELLIYEPERVVARVVAPTSGWLLLTDAWYPGWEARIDGQQVPVERADVLFRAVAVPAGQHRVEWTYRPASFRLGGAISLGLLSLLFVGALGKTLSRRWAG